MISVGKKIVHFHNGTGGGVLSVIRNLLAYPQHPEIENHVIYTINKEQIPVYNAPGLAGAASEQVFYYSPKWNFYHTCRKLSKLLPGNEAVIVAHDWLELGMVSNLGLQNPVVQVLHGDYDYYYQLAKRNEAWVDRFICVSATIAAVLKNTLPHRENDIHYLPFPVPEINGVRKESSIIQLVFAGRCEDSKGYHLLPLIDAELQQKKCKVHWHIAGPGSDNPDMQKIWNTEAVSFYGNLTQQQLNKLLLQATAFILPSLAEGMPVSVIEAMKAGAIPVVNDLRGGLQELVENDVTGYRICNNDPCLFADRLCEIATDIKKQDRLSMAARLFANIKFDPVNNARLIEDCFVQAMHYVKEKTAVKTIGSRLDQPCFPNLLVTTIRSVTN